MIDRWSLMLGDLQPLPSTHPGSVRVNYADRFGAGSLKLLDRLFGADPDDADVPRPPGARIGRPPRRASPPDHAIPCICTGA